MFYLLNCLRWQYSASDQAYLQKLNIFDVLAGKKNTLLYNVWGCNKFYITRYGYENPTLFREVIRTFEFILFTIIGRSLGEFQQTHTTMAETGLTIEKKLSVIDDAMSSQLIFQGLEVLLQKIDILGRKCRKIFEGQNHALFKKRQEDIASAEKEDGEFEKEFEVAGAKDADLQEENQDWETESQCYDHINLEDYLRQERSHSYFDKFYGQTLSNLLRMVYHLINVSFVSQDAKRIVLQFLAATKEHFVPRLLKILPVVQVREQTLILRILRKLTGIIKIDSLDEAVVRAADEDQYFKSIVDGFYNKEEANLFDKKESVFFHFVQNYYFYSVMKDECTYSKGDLNENLRSNVGYECLEILRDHLTNNESKDLLTSLVKTCFESNDNWLQQVTLYLLNCSLLLLCLELTLCLAPMDDCYKLTTTRLEWVQLTLTGSTRMILLETTANLTNSIE